MIGYVMMLRFMGERGFEPPWVAPLAPEASASANSATRPSCKLGLSPYNFSTAIPRFRLRLCKNYSTHAPYMLHNFCFASLKI